MLHNPNNIPDGMTAEEWQQTLIDFYGDEWDPEEEEDLYEMHQSGPAAFGPPAILPLVIAVVVVLVAFIFRDALQQWIRELLAPLFPGGLPPHRINDLR